MRRRTFLATTACAFAQERKGDSPAIVIYGSTPAGIAAALAAHDAGESVVLVEPGARIGGMMTCGLSHTDHRTYEAITGAYRRFTLRAVEHYRLTYGAESAQVKECRYGTHVEPKVCLSIFQSELARRPRVLVLTGLTLREARSSAGRIRELVFTGMAGRTVTLAGVVYIDATYEGDLLAAAGVPFRVGRESRAEYGESLAPLEADGQLQAYNFRFAATRVKENLVQPEAPKGYSRDLFTGVLPLLADGRIRQVFGYTPDSIYKAQIPFLPNGKFDINDVSHSPVRLSLPGENLEWPTGGAEVRQRIFDHHLLWNVGLLYFLQNDEAVPAQFRDEAREWGWCKDEFEDSGHLPPQLYVREARRMQGLRIFTERDTDHAPGDARAVLHRDAIAMGDYGPNCHGTAHEGPRFGGRHTGEFYKPVPPYQIPYGTLVPKEVTNLLAPCAASASHVGFCALRLEPIWMSLGEAAGHAAHLANRGGSAKDGRAAKDGRVRVQSVSPARIQRRLHASGAATIYVSDLSPGDTAFAAVQWWGQCGGLHGLHPAPAQPGQRGENIVGQYFRAFPGHAFEAQAPLDEATRKRWAEIARAAGVPAASIPPARRKLTRGAFVQAVYRARGRR